MGSTSTAVFIGGPYDGWVREFTDTGQKDVRYGEPAQNGYSACFNHIYDRQEKRTRDNKVVFKWNAKLSNEFWRHWAKENNVPFEMVQSQTGAMQLADPSADDRPKVRIDVRHNSRKNRWELWLPGSTDAEAVIEDREIEGGENATPAVVQQWIKELGIAR